MKRLALVLAAAVLGTGCVVTTQDPTGDATFAWNFRDWDGYLAGNFTAGNDGCALAGVTDVDLDISDGGGRVFFRTYSCTEAGSGLPRGGVVGLSEGVYTYRLTAYRLSSPVFDAVGSVSISASSQAYVEATLDVLSPIPLTLYYTQNGAYSCAGTPSVYYAVYTNASRSTLVSSTTIACSSGSYGFSLPQDLAVGSYYVDFMQLLDGGGISQYEQCALTVRHAGFPVVLDLSPAPAPSCP